MMMTESKPIDLDQDMKDSNWLATMFYHKKSIRHVEGVINESALWI